jgi:hypothetical protein
LFGRSVFGIQFIEISLVELSRDRLVDIGGRRVVPEFDIFLCGIETINISRADDDADVRSVTRSSRIDDVDPQCMPHPARVPGDHVKSTLEVFTK